MAVSNVNTFNSAQSKQQATAGGINDVDIDDFLKIMITELQNQDPLNPLENDELIAQISQIRSVGATEKLTETLDSVLLGQNISSATNLIGAEIDAISDDNQKVSGIVERVSVANGQPKLHMDLSPYANVSEDEGSIEAGDYEYRVVWTDEKNGKLFGVDPLANLDGKKITVANNGSSVELENLPLTNVAKHVYRRHPNDQYWNLIGSMSDGGTSSFTDTVSNDGMSGRVLGGTPQLIDAERNFTVSLKNVGEIRPPKK